MTFDERAVRRVTRARLRTVTGIPSDALIAWENRAFQPPPMVASPLPIWVREWQVVLSETRSATGVIEAVGETNYAVYVPRGRGTAELDELTQSIALSFQAPQSLTSDEVRVILERTSRSGLRSPADHEGWVTKVVNIRWRVFTASTTPQ